jgi:hypothetical protein
MGGSRKWRHSKLYLHKQKTKRIDNILHSLKIKYRYSTAAKKGTKQHKIQGRKTYYYDNYVMLYGSGIFHQEPRVKGMYL